MIIYKDFQTTIFQSSLFQTNSAVIETEDFVLVVDPCWLPQEVSEIRSYVRNRDQEKPLYVFYTHSDYDHIIGHGAFPTAKIIASHLFEGKNKHELLDQIKDFDDSFYLSRDYTISYPEIDIKIMEDGQEIIIGKTKLTFFHTPGHTDCGLACLIDSIGVLIVGDYLADVEFPYIYHSSRGYEDTLLKLDRLIKTKFVKLLIPGHGSPTSSPIEMQKRKNDSLEYILNMREWIQNGDLQVAYKVLDGYQYPRIMKKYLEGNIKLIKEELSQG